MDGHQTDFHSLEPDVIINDEDPADSKKHLEFDLEKFHTVNLGPEVSLIPVKKKSTFKIKIKNFLRRDTDDSDAHEAKSPRHNVRLVSLEETIKVENDNPAIKRRSLPLEKCPICKKFFRRMQTHLQKHVDVQRDPDDPLTCKFCMKGFNTYSNLSIHMRTHTGDKPYICEVCTKGFSQSCNLVNHMRIHTGERPYKCPHCDRAFTQSGNLNNHIRLHTDEKPFKCHFCEKAFTQSGNLNSHIRNNHKFDNASAALNSNFH